LENELKTEFENKKKEMLKEINKVKNSVYRQKSSKKIQVSQIQNIQNSIDDKEKAQMNKVQKLEKNLYLQEKLDQSGNNMNNSKNMNNNNKYNKEKNSSVDYNNSNINNLSNVNNAIKEREILLQPILFDYRENFRNNKDNNTYELEEYINDIEEDKDFKDYDEQPIVNNNNLLISNKIILNQISPANNINNSHNTNDFTINNSNVNMTNIFELNKKLKSFAPLPITSPEAITYEKKKELALYNKSNISNNSNVTSTVSKTAIILYEFVFEFG